MGFLELEDPPCLSIQIQKWSDLSWGCHHDWMDTGIWIHRRCLRSGSKDGRNEIFGVPRLGSEKLYKDMLDSSCALN